MKYFFILGNHPELSLAEIYSVLSDQAEYLSFAHGILIVETEILDAQNLINNLGGTIKIGQVLGQIKNIATESKDVLAEMLQSAEKPLFGVSLYGAKYNFLPIALTLKKELKINDRAPRFVVSREPVLSSVVVEQNKLTSGGLEAVFIKDNNSYWYGKTLAVQPFKDLSARDYGRPSRDDASGMLPPKLARLMINLAVVDKQELLVDPFCGSGTILSEALLAGFQKIWGSDISQKAIGDAQNNLAWIGRRYNLDFDLLVETHCMRLPQDTRDACNASLRQQVQLQVYDAAKLSSIVKPNSVGAVVTEPYLGPQQAGKLEPKAAAKNLENLYSETLKQLARIVCPGGRIVMAWPVFMAGSKSVYLNLNPENFGLHQVQNLLPTNLKYNQLQLTQRQTLLYGRQGQRVWREIVVLEK